MQGSPPIGCLPHLSSGDIDQTNHLYLCSEPVGQGFLMVKITHCINLRAGNKHDQDPYVKVSSTIPEFYKQTSTPQNPTWNEWLLFNYSDSPGYG